MGLKLLIVNYHYIRELLPACGIYNITPSAFEKQLESIHSHGYCFISLENLHHAIRNKDPQSLNAKSCLITFDDGLKESYELGLSILDRKGIPGAFYISSFTLGRNKVLDVHKFHHIQSVMDVNEILSYFPVAFSARLDAVTGEAIKNQYIWDNQETAKVKYLINFLLNAHERAGVVQKLFEACITSEQEFAANLYMTEDEIKDIASRNSLGSHGASHSPLACLPKKEICHEIAESRSALMNFTGVNIEAISYPYGGESAVSDVVFEAAGKNNFISGMTMMRGLNSEIDILSGYLQLKRFDTNDVFGGKSEAMYKDLFHD